MRFLILASLAAAALFGTPQATTLEVVVPRACVVDIQPDTDFECHGPDMDHLRCTGLKLKVIKDCEQIHVKGQ